MIIHHPAIDAMEQSLSKYYTEELPNIEVLASECNMSASTFKRYFKLKFKQSVYAYYLGKKMQLGRQMLSETRMSVSEVAYHLGYNKINSFSRIFKKHFGCLPREWRGREVEKIDHDYRDEWD